jgi:hypothetical protein
VILAARLHASLRAAQRVIGEAGRRHSSTASEAQNPMTPNEMLTEIVLKVGPVEFKHFGTVADRRHSRDWWQIEAKDKNLVIIYRFDEPASADFSSGPSFSRVYHIGDTQDSAIRNLYKSLTNPRNRIEVCTERPVPFIKAAYAAVGVEVSIQ